MSEFYVVCFDVSDKRRLRKVSNALENFGSRVQCSVFECYLNAGELDSLKQMLSQLIDPSADHIRYYSLCGKDRSGILVDGSGCVSRDDAFHFC